MKLIVCALALGFGALIFFSIDAFCGRKTAVTGIVVGHDYTQEVVTYTSGPNNTLVPYIQPACYYLQVKGPHGYVTIQTEPYEYMTPVGTPVGYTESLGLITGTLYSL
jgi:hypothetical protein